MAQQVPYSGAPSIEPGAGPIPGANVQATPAAFGVTQAAALEQEGRTTGQVGQELFDRAYAMQQLHETAAANAALADFQNKSLDSFTNYLQTEGKTAVDGYQPFVNGLDKVRQDTQNTLSSPIAQQMFDEASRQSRFRMAMSGAFHAGDENKKFIIGASRASVSSAINQIDGDPNNEGTYNASIAKIRQEVDHQMTIGGISPSDPQYTNAMQTDVSRAVMTKATAMARTDPLGAQKFLDRAVQAKDITGDDIDKASGYVRSQLLTIGSRQVASQAYADPKATGGPVLRAMLGNESGGRNIIQGNIGDINNVIANATGNKDALAQGYFQITGPTWREYALKAGVDPTKYPNPMSGATYDIQASVASVIPLNQWGAKTIAAMRATGAQLDLHKTLGENLSANGESFGAGVGPQDSLSDKVARGRALADQNHPGDTEFQDAVQTRTEALYNADKRVQQQTEFDNRQTIEGALVNGVGPNNQIPTTVEELRQDPKASAAWDQMLPSDQRKYMGVMASQAKGNVAWNDTRLQTYQGLIGEATHDPQKFQGEDIISKDLPMGAKKELLQQQQRVFNKSDADPNLSRALGQPGVKSQLQSLGLTMQGDKANLFLFSGAYQDELKSFAAENNRQPTAAESEEIATKLLQPLSTGGWWSRVTGSTTPFFEADVPQDWADKAKAAAQAQNGYTPSDQELARWYIQMQYQHTYGKPAKALTAGSNGGR